MVYLHWFSGMLLCVGVWETQFPSPFPYQCPGTSVGLGVAQSWPKMPCGVGQGQGRGQGWEQGQEWGQE